MKQFTAKVIKKSSDKTVCAITVNRIPHPKYIKSSAKTKKYLVHDDQNIAKEGDTILIQAYRPISKRKNHILVKVVKDDNK